MALLVGVQVHFNTSFEEIIEPTASSSTTSGWRAKLLPENHPLSKCDFDVVIGFYQLVLPVGFPGVQHFGILNAVLASPFVQKVKEPFDSRRQVFVHSQNGAEEIDDKLFNGPLGGEQSRQKDLRNCFGRSIHHLTVGRLPLFAAGTAVVHGRANQVESLQMVAVLSVAVAVAILLLVQDRSQRCVEMIGVDTWVGTKRGDQL